MKAAAFRAFCRLRDEFEAQTRTWAKATPWLAGLQEELRTELGYEDYRVETPIVFNEALREVEASCEPAFVLVADNPGKNEQLARNRRYLVGQSGKLAEGWFRRELDIDFRKEVILINKTPLHTPKTAELRKLLVLAGERSPARREALRSLLDESQRWMAGMARRLHEALGVPLWISGYGELGPRGLFAPYSEALALEYAKAPAFLREGVLLFRHFSMNQFAIEMKEKRKPGLPLRAELERIGSDNRKRLLGW
ncbi:MAG TPA: hypothetical protein VMV44_13305 [Rectinemataceae bacterium]|nr:hypothetical protein [Rectinemataceae bacterium]